MSGRPAAPVAQLDRTRHVWCAEVPWLPDLLSHASTVTLTGSPLTEAFGRQIAFLRAVAAGAPPDSALQLRYAVDPPDGRVRCHLWGAAPSDLAATLLNQIVITTLPAEFPLEPLRTQDVSETLNWIDLDTISLGSSVEIRRSIDRLDPTVDDVTRDDPVLFPWHWSPQAMLGTLGLLRFQPQRTVLAVHVERSAFPPEVGMFLQDEIRRLVADLRAGEENPLALSVLRSYRRWLRLLPQGCLSMRMVLATDGQLTPGIAESLVTDLTRSFEGGSEASTSTAAVVEPASMQEVDAVATLLGELRATRWRPAPHSELAALQHLFDPLEAHTAFRLPVAPKGGLAGIASRRISSIGQGFDAEGASGSRRVSLGMTASGGRFDLTLDDVRQHILVAGLPGFGKTSTVQLLLTKLLVEHQAPFLVIDPAKRDYEPLLASLQAGGHDVRVIRLERAITGFNPLAVPEGVDPETHAGRVLAAFDAAFDLSSWYALAYIQLSRALYRLYDTSSRTGLQPTMADLYRTVGSLVRRSAFSREVRSNLEGSLLSRLELLMTGPTGRVLAGGRADAVPWADLLARPALVELSAFASPADRALLFSLLIAGLVSYREANPLPAGGLHVTVLEEAHRVLRPVTARDAGVEVFVDAIAELRGAGEGFVVVDQAPSLLHPAVLKLTGTKLAHRLVEFAERTAVGASMVLDQAQVEDIARLAQRRMVAYAASGSTASLVDVEEWRMPKEQTTPAASFTAKPRTDILFCVDCPVMCEGSAGSKRAAEVDLAAAARLPARQLLQLARSITGNPQQAYCLAATVRGQTLGTHQSSLLDALGELSTTYKELARKASS